MSSETLFLKPVVPTVDPHPNFAEATGSAQFFNSSHSASGSLTSAELKVLVEEGVAIAIAEAEATFFKDPAFSDLFTNTFGVGEDEAFKVKSKSQTKVVANYNVGANQTFSFDFAANLALNAKEIENPKIEYNKAQSKTAFLVLDTSNSHKPKILDFFGINANLISANKIGFVKLGSSRHVNIGFSDKTLDVNGNNGIDSATGFATGQYQRTFKRESQITVVEINTSVVKLLGDTLIGKLGKDVIYGTIWDDNLSGTDGADKMYGSLGNDILVGKKGNDLIEGGQGKDKLFGYQGNDILVGGSDSDLILGGQGNDTLIGGMGDDYLVGEVGDDELTGNSGADRFTFLTKGDRDRITDFEAGIDKIVLSKTIFTALTKATDGLIKTDEFAAVADDVSATLSNAVITYSTGTGNLFYNPKGAGDGLESAVQFATLESLPILSATDFLMT